MVALDVDPAVLFKVKDLAVFLVDFSVPMRPYSRVFKFKQGMHARPEETGVVFFSQEIRQSFHGFMHGFFEGFR